jgi:hypothetical protein
MHLENWQTLSQSFVGLANEYFKKKQINFDEL